MTVSVFSRHSMIHWHFVLKLRLRFWCLLSFRLGFVFWVFFSILQHDFWLSTRMHLYYQLESPYTGPSGDPSFVL